VKLFSKEPSLLAKHVTATGWREGVKGETGWRRLRRGGNLLAL
jgi:hypothetical protein